MNVYNLLKNQLQQQNLDGLYNIKNECVCVINNDFIPCNEPLIDCHGGINIPLSTNVDDFYICSINKALKNWPICPECMKLDKNQENETHNIPCIDCKETGYFLRNDDDYYKLNNLLHRDSYKKSKFTALKKLN